MSDNPKYVGFVIHTPKDNPKELFPFRQSQKDFAVIFRKKSRARGVIRKNFGPGFRTKGVTREELKEGIIPQTNHALATPCGESFSTLRVSRKRG